MEARPLVSVAAQGKFMTGLETVQYKNIRSLFRKPAWFNVPRALTMFRVAPNSSGQKRPLSTEQLATGLQRPVVEVYPW